MNPLLKVLEDTVHLLDRLQVPYAIMGGLAVRVYGIPRPTYDIDFTIAMSRDRLTDFYANLIHAGYSVPEEYRSGWVDSVGGLPLVKFRTFVDVNSIDIDLFLAETPFQRELLRRRREEHVNDLRLMLVTPEDLILLKLIANRPRDLADIGDVRFTMGQLDEEYLRQWAEALGILDRLETVLAEPPI